jgi:ATP-binding cassette subfamily B protein
MALQTTLTMATTTKATTPMRRLIRHAAHHRRRVTAAVVCSILNKIFDLAPPVLIGAAVDVVVEREDSMLAGWGVVDVELQLIVLAIATVVIWGLESGFEYAYQWLWRNLAQTVQHELRLDAYGHIQELDMAWFSDQSRGELMSVLNDDINQLERFMDGGANDLLQVATTVVVVGATFVGISPGIAVWAVLPMPLVLIGSFWFQGHIAPRYAEVRERVGTLNAILDNNLAGIATIKSFTAEAREAERVRHASEAYRQSNRKAIALSSAFAPLIRMVIVVGFTATLLYGGHLALDGHLAVGAYSVLVFLTQRLLWPLTRLGQTFDLYQRAMASTQRVLDLLDLSVHLVSGTQRLENPQGAVSFEGVHFAYPDRAATLTDIDLHIPAGQTLAIVGPTGSGKTTLMRLLLRFHDPTAGVVRLDGQDLRQLETRSLRQAISLVSQQVTLFPGTVAENIAYGRPDATRTEIEAAAQLAEAAGFITELPSGYDTPIGEGGQKLSGGQRQRLALARAVLKDAPILVLDEATSAVDNETEAAIQRSMARISQGRTTIVIAHRLSTVRRADEIVVLERGRVVERGTHDQLMGRGGLYTRLWRVQTGEQEVA